MKRKSKTTVSFWRLAFPAAFAVQVSFGSQELQDVRAASGSAKESAVERAAAWLVGQQRNDGTWPGRGMANTALAALAVAEGSIPFWSADSFRGSIRNGRKAMLEWIESGPDTAFEDDPVGLSVAVFSLAQTPRFGDEEETRTCLDHCVETICKNQKPDGSWSFGQDPANLCNDRFLTAWAVLALESALRCNIRNDRCRKALSLYAKGFHAIASDVAVQGFEDVGPLASLLAAHAVDLISDDNGRSVSNLLEKRFGTIGVATLETNRVPSFLQLSFLARTMALPRSKNDFDTLASLNSDLVRMQMPAQDETAGSVTENPEVGYWSSPGDHRFLVAETTRRFSPDARSGLSPDEMISGRIQDTCFCILHFAMERQLRLLPQIPRVSILETEQSKMETNALHRKLPLVSPVDKIKRR